MRFDLLIFRRIFATLLLLGAVVMLLSMAHPLRGQTTNSSIVTSLKYNLGLLSLLPEPVLDPVVDPPGNFHAVKPQEFDPGKTYLVQAAWLHGTGCPTNATIALPNTDFNGIGGFSTFTDPACMTGDPGDQRNAGLLLVKTGPTITNFASATADLINVKGLTLTELGYDIRKPGPGTSFSALGSHCGAGAPRFNITTTTGFFFLGCSSPPPDMQTLGTGWIRLRWGTGVPGSVLGFSPPTFALVPITGTVQRITIVFDEAQDAFGGPDEFGAAILDNIDVNGVLVGRGATDAS